MKLKIIKDYLKEKTKEYLHSISLFKYRKSSKRYKFWNGRRERNFLKEICRLQHHTNNESIKVSVIMPAYNRVNIIDKALQSIINQSHSNWELIIVDDGSDDGLDEYIDKFSSDKRVNYHKKLRGGVSQARNYGLEMSKGKYIFYLDTDNTWYPDFLRNMVLFMEHSTLDACYSGISIKDDNGSIIGYYGEEFNWKECWELNHIDINGFAHRSDLLKEGYRFDETLTRLVDWDFILAITAMHRTAYAPFLGVEYYDGSQGKRITYTEHLGDEITDVIKYIQIKHQKLLYNLATKSKHLRPNWKDILG